jgi:ABC-type dipeptide/oligopeptide/nickel transport system ATPase component
MTDQTALAADAQVYTIPGMKTLLVGETGTGKTHAIASLVAAGLKPFVLFTEPGMATLAKAISEMKLPPDAIHWKYISQASQDWGVMLDMSKKIGTFSYEALAKMSDANRNKYGQWYNLLTSCANFVSDRTGESFGDVSTWDTDRVLVIDSLSGLNQMSMDLVVGSKPTKSMPDWMVAMDNLERFINKITTDLRCHVVLTAHIEPEKNEVTGGIQLMVSTLGRRLAPKLPRNFDDVIQCVRAETEFNWSTATHNMSLKSRYAPISNKFPPDFGPLVKKWIEYGGAIIPTQS